MQDLSIIIKGGSKESRDAIANVIYSALCKYGIDIQSNKIDLTNIVCEKILKNHIEKTPNNLSLIVEA